MLDTAPYSARCGTRVHGDSVPIADYKSHDDKANRGHFVLRNVAS